MNHPYPSYRHSYPVVVDFCDTPQGKIFGAFVPDVAGCSAMGKSLETVLMDIRRILHFALLQRIKDGRALPPASSIDDLVVEYELPGKEICTSQGMVLMIEVSLDIVVSSAQIARAA